MSTSDTQVISSSMTRVPGSTSSSCRKFVIQYDVDKLGQANQLDDFSEHFGECYNLIAQHNLFELSQSDDVLYILQHLAEHFNFVIPHDFVSSGEFNALIQLTFTLNVFELIFIFLPGINTLSLIYEQLNQQFNQQLNQQLAFQLKLLKKLHIVTHEQPDD
ncbi:hypothetical protein KC331_g17813 [Hortaea werneckii]|nr:hypothetical protein KC331_g17813 [Hortaea werneckii]KAI7699935.1 hypothetical protein KC353_g16169 [Hortaea werneckii]